MAWLRTVFALLIVLDAPLAVWIVRHYNGAPTALLIVDFVLAIVFSGIIVWIVITIGRLLKRLGDTP